MKDRNDEPANPRKSDEPPHSRIFIIHDKTTKKEDLEKYFYDFGEVEDVHFVLDRNTKEPKGVTYIKYSKMSEAAHAAEEMNGACLPNCGRPLKVVIASSRGEDSKRDDDPERLLRLFVTVPKDNSINEQKLKEYFRQFGEIDYAHILRDRDTNESKGYAYVKFFKVYDTAKALEQSDPKFRAVLARPRKKRELPPNHETTDRPILNYLTSLTQAPPIRDIGAREYIESSGEFSGKGYTTLSAFICSQLSEPQAVALFNIVPGLKTAYMTDEVISHRTRRMILEYASPSLAQYACHKFDGFEYPSRELISVKPEMRPPPPPLVSIPPPSFAGKRGRDDVDYVEQDTGDASLKRKIAALNRALAEATSLLKSAGLAAFEQESVDEQYSVSLPSPKPILKNENGKYRLFVVCKPEAPPVHILRDVFCRFGNMTECYLLANRNCGYVCYCVEESAREAIRVLDEQEVFGSRLKVLEADPPRATNKRIRT